jgi:hypothetical protein
VHRISDLMRRILLCAAADAEEADGLGDRGPSNVPMDWVLRIKMISFAWRQA